MESNLSRQRARSDIVRTAEGREKVVQRHLVRQVDGRQAQAPFIAVAPEEVVVPQAEIKQVSGRNPLPP